MALDVGYIAYGALKNATRTNTPHPSSPRVELDETSETGRRLELPRGSKACYWGKFLLCPGTPRRVSVYSFFFGMNSNGLLRLQPQIGN